MNGSIRKRGGSWELRVSARRIQLGKRLNFGHLRLHDFRHFMATTMLTEGVPVSVVAGRLGHSRASTTLNIYSHFVEAGDHDAADLISGLLDNQVEEPRESDQRNLPEK